MPLRYIRWRIQDLYSSQFSLSNLWLRPPLILLLRLQDPTTHLQQKLLPHQQEHPGRPRPQSTRGALAQSLRDHLITGRWKEVEWEN